MTHEAFALSLISARAAAQQGEADYGTIREVFMGMAPGRRAD
jgi:hypothetical protein